MIRLILDGEGRLFTLQARPPAIGSADSGASAPDGTVLFNASGLDQSRFTPAPPQRTPPMAFDARAAWTGTFAESRTEKVRIEAASWQGHPVFFRTTGDWSRPQAAPVRAGEAVGFVIFTVLLAGAGLTAWNNLRLGRGDRRGAGKIAAFTFLLAMCLWALEAQHVGSYWELQLAVNALSFAAFLAGLFWSLYIAIEPYVRRHWPDALISWTRLQSGRLRDPLVASHVLAGIAAAGLVGVFAFSLDLAGSRLWGPWSLDSDTLSPLNSVAGMVSGVLEATLIVIGLLFIVVLLRLLIRRMIVADIAGSLLLGAISLNASAGLPENIMHVAASALGFYILVWMSRRFGLLATWVLVVATGLVQVIPLTFSSWYTSRAMVTLAILTAIAAWALWVILSTQRRPDTITSS